MVNSDNKETFKMTTLSKRYSEIAHFIESNGSKFMTIEFVKKNGEKRSINFNPRAAKNHLVDEYKSASTAQAVETRKANNPHLLAVWEHNNSDGSTKFRSINMDTVLRIACGRKEIRYL